jgi:hypothetical protein
MSFPFSQRSARVEGVFLALVLVGCGSSDAAGTGGGGSCAPGEFTLNGTLDGQAVTHRGTVTGHAWVQAGSPYTLDVQSEPTASLHAEWTTLVMDNGGTAAITGSVTLPSGVPHGGETLGAEAGTLTKFADEVQLEYSKLSVSVACITAPCPASPVEGSLKVCLNWNTGGP